MVARHHNSPITLRTLTQGLTVCQSCFRREQKSVSNNSHIPYI